MLRLEAIWIATSLLLLDVRTYVSRDASRRRRGTRCADAQLRSGACTHHRRCDLVKCGELGVTGSSPGRSREEIATPAEVQLLPGSTRRFQHVDPVVYYMLKLCEHCVLYARTSHNLRIDRHTGARAQTLSATSRPSRHVPLQLLTTSLQSRA